MVLRGIISMWMVWITFATITVVIKKLRGHNWDDLAWKHTWTRRWKTRLLAPWCGHGYTFSSTMCAFMCIFHLWNIHTAGYFNAHDIHLGPNTLFQIVWRLDERAFTVRHHETWPPSLIVWLRRFKLYLIDCYEADVVYLDPQEVLVETCYQPTVADYHCWRSASNLKQYVREFIITRWI